MLVYRDQFGFSIVSKTVPELREMVGVARESVGGRIHFSYLAPSAGLCAYWSKVYGLHPAIQRLASDWSLWVDQTWNEYGQHKPGLTESELRRRIAADL